MERNILIVEDEDEVRKILVAALDVAGYHTSSASNGAEMETALAGHPSAGDLLILMDIALQNENGVDLAVLAAKQFGAGKFLFISAYVDNVLMLHSAIRGAEVSFLRKPFNHAELLAAVEGMFVRRASTGV